MCFCFCFVSVPGICVCVSVQLACTKKVQAYILNGAERKAIDERVAQGKKLAAKTAADQRVAFRKKLHGLFKKYDRNDDAVPLVDATCEYERVCLSVGASMLYEYKVTCLYCHPVSAFGVCVCVCVCVCCSLVPLSQVLDEGECEQLIRDCLSFKQVGCT